MTDRKTYQVTAERDGRWYAIQIDGLPPNMCGVSQSPADEGMEGVESMAREVVSLLLDVPEGSFDLEVREGDLK